MLKNTARRLQMESLENRELMAGNVSVAFSGIDLYITGDDARNLVEVRQSSPGVYKITGQTIGGAATKVNGGANGTCTATGVTGNVFVSLKGGDDQLDFGTGDQRVIDVNKNLQIDMGAGSDFTNVRDVKVGGQLSVLTGTGVKDQTFVTGAQVGTHLLIADPTGGVYSGDYDVATVLNCRVNGQIALLFSRGNDSAEVQSCAADSIYADMGDGNDFLKISYTRPRAISAYGGRGTDTFYDFSGISSYTSGFESIRR